MARFGSRLLKLLRRRRNGLGNRPDPEDKRDLDFQDLSLPSSDLRAGENLFHPSQKMFNQGPVSSCVGQAAAGAAMVAVWTNTGKLWIPSALFPYYNSRRLHDRFVTDSGTWNRACMAMIYKLGLPEEKYWSYSTSRLKVNRRPSWLAYRKAHRYREGGYYRIKEESAARSLSIKAAISAGDPVLFATTVYQSFMPSKGPGIVHYLEPSKDKIVGGHAMVIIGYRYDEKHGPLFLVRNSWGEDWRDRGYVWMSAAYIESRETRDVWVFRGLGGP